MVGNERKGQEMERKGRKWEERKERGVKGRKL